MGLDASGIPWRKAGGTAGPLLRLSGSAGGFWLEDDNGKPTRAVQHICWDGCMFPNATMTQQKTWDDILGVMAAVRDAHGWD